MFSLETLWMAKTGKYSTKKSFSSLNSTVLSLLPELLCCRNSARRSSHGYHSLDAAKSMLSFSWMKTISYAGSSWSGSLKTFLSHCKDAFSIAQRNRRSTLASSTTEKVCGTRLWGWRSLTYWDRLWSQSKSRRWRLSARTISRHQASSDWSPRETHSAPLWPSTERYLVEPPEPHRTRETNHWKESLLITVWEMLTWCSKTWSLRCLSISLASLYSTMMISCADMKPMLTSGNRMAVLSFTLWPWISRSAMTQSSARSLFSSFREVIFSKESTLLLTVSSSNAKTT